MKMHQTGRKAVCLILALLMALSLVACGPASESAAAGAQPATGTAKGFGGDVTVTITVENGKITAASAEGASETEGVGSVAVEQLPQQMVDSQTLEVDAIAGATVPAPLWWRPPRPPSAAWAWILLLSPATAVPPLVRTPPTTPTSRAWARAARA